MRKAILSLVVVIGLFAMTRNAVPAQRGDMDCDGDIDLVEAIIALQVAAGMATETDFQTPCGASVLGIVEWNGTSVDFIGTLTKHMSGCRQNADGVYWEYAECIDDCSRLAAGGSNCRGMCNNIRDNFSQYTDDYLCLQEATIPESLPDSVELGRIDVDTTGGIVVSGTLTSSVQGCRQNLGGIFWNYDACMADCSILGAGGLNCRSTCNLIKGETNTNVNKLCSY